MIVVCRLYLRVFMWPEHVSLTHARYRVPKFILVRLLASDFHILHVPYLWIWKLQENLDHTISSFCLKCSSHSMPKLCRSGLAIVLNQIYPLVVAAAWWVAAFFSPSKWPCYTLFLKKHALIIANMWQFSHKKVYLCIKNLSSDSSRKLNSAHALIVCGPVSLFTAV